MDELIFGDVEVTADLVGEFFGIVFSADSFEAAGLKDTAAGRKGDGVRRVAEVEEAEAGAEEDERSGLADERSDVKAVAGSSEPAIWGVVGAEGLEHVSERGVGCFRGRTRGEVGLKEFGKLGVTPAMDDR